MADAESAPVKGHRSTANPIKPRFHQQYRESVADNWFQLPDDPPKTSVRLKNAESIISRNQSPDRPFSDSINVYRGCEQGCI